MVEIEFTAVLDLALKVRDNFVDWVMTLEDCPIEDGAINET